ncbi:MAG: CoB--CoM heterodisulfide reductase iron-sulfur subunit A family protein [Deltaproteobacteria bacterium]|nr:CoB--CoM heterodisulfide reductase iron-sulfur subunit A family protein [Deltaproteobacteria bacterium]MBW2354025.1 CoB--CoM heterodisulfide reductase iron-sulfur subunit A family protein [Deltaproteobacteria bacterium]
MSKKKPQEEEMRIGVFICDCGSNIAGHLDCAAVTEYGSNLPGVVYAKENLYTCSEAGIVEIQKGIKDHNLNRVVVASCSPRTHQPLFQSSCAAAGLNPYLFEMVNIRDQCSWVHMQERDRATEKAKDLVRMGVSKAAFLEPQDDIEASLIPRVLVIGAGVAGLSAAETMADMGLEVVLVEKEAEPGGLLNDLYRLSPYGENSSERIGEIIKAVSSKPNVTLYTGSRVEDIGGYIGNFEITVRQDGGETVQEKVGCVVVATGAVPLTPEGLYGYNGRDVITQMELEERLLKGEVDAKGIVMIQCAGARSPEREYCSRICCQTAVKNARLLREQSPETRVHILYRDMQMYGTENEQMLWDARGEGVRFDVFSPDRPPEVGEGKVSFYQPLTGERVEIPCELTVLSTPLVPREDSASLSQLLRVPVDQNGFFLEAHAKLRPLDFATDGIFVCGSARYPANVEEARSQGLGVSSRIATILFKEKLVTSAIVAEIDPATCVGCMGCMEMCPYGAIDYLPEEGVCRVNRILCKGCGCCASTCPSQSAMLKGFKPNQLLAQIRAV